MKAWEEELAKIYYDPKHPGSFSGLAKLDKAVKSINKFRISKARITRWLREQETYTNLRGVRRTFARPRVMVDGANAMWDVDLADVSNTDEENDGTKFILVTVDVFSRRAHLRPLRGKTSDDVIGALRSIFEEEKPVKMRSDKGSEFVNRKVAKFLKNANVLQSVTQNEVKANYAERFIKTLKNKLHHLFLRKQDLRYLEVLQDLADGYNNTVHESIATTPNRAAKKNKEDELWEDQYVYPFWKDLQKRRGKKEKKKKNRFAYKIGQRVKISFLREPFSREYHQKWTSEIFTIRKRRKLTAIPVYEIDDFAGDTVKGIFYQNELQKVEFDPDQAFKVEKIVDRRGRGRNKQVKVRWLGWPKKYDQWLPETAIQMTGQK